jgi:hypothetical protein
VATIAPLALVPLIALVPPPAASAAPLARRSSANSD